ncbi:MAG: helix-turn-helix transcriptional regulator [Clostridia bacterium]|nr:helix-turn-helix transcriptional regulator [Clostridia bacterium]
MTEEGKNTNNDGARIGEIIKAHRIKKGMTQAQLGEELFVTKQAVSKWENCRALPDIEMMRRISEILEISNDEMFRLGIKTSRPERPAPVPPITKRKNAPLPDTVPVFSSRAKRLTALAVMIFITALVTVSAFLFLDYPISVRSRGVTDIPKESFDGAYEMLEMIESNDTGVVFAVRERDAEYEDVMFFTPQYSRLFVTEAYWANNNYDFFVLSHDTGVHPYIFKNSTWESGYIIRITESEQGENSAELISLSDDSSTKYDINNVPREIINYLINRND